MADFTALNFIQMMSPGGGAAPTANSGQGGLLSANPLAGSSLFGVNATTATNTPTTDIFTLLLGQNNALPKQEKFTSTGKILPAKPVDVSKPEEKTVDNSLGALQSVLAGLTVQQSTPVPVKAEAITEVQVAAQVQETPIQPETIFGGEGNDTVVGGTLGQVQNTSYVVPPVTDTLASADEIPTTTHSDAIAAYQLLQNQGVQKKESLLAQAQNLLNNTIVKQPVQQDIAQIQVPQNDVVNNNPAPQPLDNKVLQALQDKTLSAYRATTALTQPEVGSQLNTSDLEEANNKVALLAQQPATADKPAVAPSNTIIVNTPAPKDDVSQTVEDALARLKNLAAGTPLPKVQEEAKVTVVVANAVQPTVTKPAPLPSEGDAKKLAEKIDPTLQSNATTTVTPQAVSQVSQQQNQLQQFSQKKSGTETIESVKATDEKTAINDVQLNPAAPHKVAQHAETAHDFADQLSKTIASPAEQIAMKIAHLPAGKQNITIHLDPVDLGKVDVKLEWNGGDRPHISIVAEHKETLEMLKGDMGALQRSLSDSGIKADASNLQFSLRGQDSFAGQFAQSNQQQKNEGGHAQQQSSNSDLKQTIESASLAARYINLNNLVDLHV
jgi:flagellar hook-length control protein FliK